MIVITRPANNAVPLPKNNASADSITTANHSIVFID